MTRSKRSIHFAPKDRALRDDVRMLGALVGEVLMEQRGSALLELVERVRKAAIARRQGGVRAENQLRTLLAGMEPVAAADLVRAFSTYFQVVNMAEKVHRIRRRRDYLRSAQTPQPGSLKSVLHGLADDGIEAEVILDLLKRFCLELVFTAHPTESTRRTLLEKEQQIVKALVDRLDPSRTPQEEAIAWARIRDAVTCMWQTQLHPRQRPTVADEMEHVLFYLSDVLYRVVPAFYEALREALSDAYGTELAEQTRFGTLLRFVSWVGGDMDGNPNVNAHTIAQTLREQRGLIIATYLPEVRKLARALSQSTTEVGISEAVRHRCDRYRSLLPEVAQTLRAREANMPYRTLLRLMAVRLERTLAGEPGAYDSSAEFLTDIQHIRTSLEQNGGRHAGHFALRRLLLRTRTFGFHLAKLDLRQDALVHRRAVAALLNDSGWLERSADERGQRLDQLLQTNDLSELNTTGEELDTVLQVFKAIVSGREQYGGHAFGAFIVSMTQGADDVLTVLLLARVVGLVEQEQVPLDVAPLLETVDDLSAGLRILKQLWTYPSYSAHLARLDQRQLVMIGYSDSSKDGGIASARWALQNAQVELVALGREHAVEVTFFHGRGGTVSRGGGNSVNGILAAPAGSVNGYFRVTEQGEVIAQKYGVRSIALRHLEQTAGAILTASIPSAGNTGQAEPWREIMEFIATQSRQAYRELVYDNEQFWPYFRQATPIDVIERMAIGSRPASRRSGQGMANLRAIPWVFAWAQTRIGLPGAYGFGAGVEQAAARFGQEALVDMAQQWPFFANLISDVEMVLAKSDLDIGRQYSVLAEQAYQGIYRCIHAEMERVEHWILTLKGSQALLDQDPTLQRSIRLRNPYVDPMNLMQVDLLKRWRKRSRKDDGLLKALITTVNGIAQGIQNTG